ncbi:MAG: YeeE/YedE thiosulfate transporter family protein [Acetobacteraceae bacterium]|nr:YeeE/YedE thiosulfate transporter family protein [Acetobacteraceae bacterium]
MTALHPALPSAPPSAAGRHAAATSTRLGLGAASVLLLALGAAWLEAQHGWRLAALWLVGAGLGFVLHRTAFTFAGGFRALLTESRTRAMRAQLLLLGLGAVLFLPTFALAPAWGLQVGGMIAPAGAATALGAFLFGIGMHWAGACVSGHAVLRRGGKPPCVARHPLRRGRCHARRRHRRVLVRPARPPPVSLQGLLGTAPALALILGLLWLAWAGLATLERRRTGAVEPLFGSRQGLSPLAWGAAALALLNLATLLVAGRPWGIVAAFPLWGSRLIGDLGLDDPLFWAWWEEQGRSARLLAPLTADRFGVMAVALVIGAGLSAALTGRMLTSRPLTLRAAAGAAFGGTLLGFGAILAGGCNISAYVSGIASGSLHGWLWIASALAGYATALRLARRLGGGD